MQPVRPADEDARSEDEFDDDTGLEVDPDTGEVLDLDKPLAASAAKQDLPRKRSSSALSGAPLASHCHCIAN